jgi:hypothetical protein
MDTPEISFCAQIARAYVSNNDEMANEILAQAMEYAGNRILVIALMFGREDLPFSLAAMWTLDTAQSNFIDAGAKAYADTLSAFRVEYISNDNTVTPFESMWEKNPPVPRESTFMSQMREAWKANDQARIMEIINVGVNFIGDRLIDIFADVYEDDVPFVLAGLRIMFKRLREQLSEGEEEMLQHIQENSIIFASDGKFPDYEDSDEPIGDN